MKYSSNTRLWLFILFLACMMLGLFLAWKFPMDEQNYAKQYDMINWLAVRLFEASIIAALLFFLCGLVSGLIKRYTDKIVVR